MKSFIKVLACLIGGLMFSASVQGAENTPKTCPLGSLLEGFECRGDYCDEIRLMCGDRKFETTNREWLEKFFSEEQGAAAGGYGGHIGRCDGFITGVSCKGSYCDNIALECSSLKDVWYHPNHCYWSDWVSEETRHGIKFTHPPTAMECRGSYCDDKRFYLCPLRHLKP